MAKQPTIAAITNVYTDKAKMNENFANIKAAFIPLLSRDGSTPNAFLTDFDIADANVTNTNIYKGEQLIVNGYDVLSYQDFLMYSINELTFTTGGMVYAPAADEVAVLAIGATGQVLKSSGIIPVWGTDVDTDTNTVGVTVQEDGVTVLENVTTIDFTWPSSVLVSSPGAGQVDLAMTDLLSALWEDTTQDDTNLDPESGSIFSNPAEVTRVNLVDTVGISIPTGNNQYYVMAEASNYFETTGPVPADGLWTVAVKFFDDTGSSTPLTGVEIGKPGGETDSRIGGTDGGNLVTVVCGIPSGTKYVDFGWSLLPTFPLSLTLTNFCDRYRAIISAGQIALETPNGVAHPGAIGASTCPTS
jgi:hypothetical protein